MMTPISLQSKSQLVPGGPLAALFGPFATLVWNAVMLLLSGERLQLRPVETTTKS